MAATMRQRASVEALTDRHNAPLNRRILHRRYVLLPRRLGAAAPEGRDHLRVRQPAKSQQPFVSHPRSTESGGTGKGVSKHTYDSSAMLVVNTPFELPRRAITPSSAPRPPPSMGAGGKLSVVL